MLCAQKLVARVEASGYQVTDLGEEHLATPSVKFSIPLPPFDKRRQLGPVHSELVCSFND